METIEDKRHKFMNGIPHKYILVDKSGKKPWVKGNADTQNWTLEEAARQHIIENKRGHICCNYNLKDTGIAVFDVDTDDYSHEQICNDLNIGINSTMWVKGNTKGFHLWVGFQDGVYKKPSDKNIVKCMKHCEGDYLGATVFERIDKDWKYKTTYPDLAPCIKVVTEEMINSCFNMEKK